MTVCSAQKYGREFGRRLYRDGCHLGGIFEEGFRLHYIHGDVRWYETEFARISIEKKFF